MGGCLRAGTGAVRASAFLDTQVVQAYRGSGGGGENCDPNYAGAFLDPNSPDYDCEGGSGNGPDYTGPVRVVGDDPHGLDADGDGLGCE